MTRRYTGGFISATEQATDANTANGVFSLQEAGALTAAGQFPIGRWTPQRSLRIRNTANAYLQRTNATTGDNALKWTVSAWVKNDTTNTTFILGSNTGTNAFVWFALGSVIEFRVRNSSSVDLIRLASSTVFRDPSAWYHAVAIYDTSNAIASERVRLFVNGVRITDFGTETTPSINQAPTGTFLTNMQIGRSNSNSSNMNYGGNSGMTEMNFIDGQALDPSYFGMTDPETGTWVPKRYDGAYGTNGWYLDFSDNSAATTTTIGADRSGNGNNWTPNNFSLTPGTTYDSLVDVPGICSVSSQNDVGGVQRGNYATWNPLSKKLSILSDGNTKSAADGAGYADVITTFPTATTGKWYAEITMSFSQNINWPINMGISNGIAGNTYLRLYTDWSARAIGKSVNGVTSSVTPSGPFPVNGDILKIAYDADAGNLWLGLNNTWYGASGSLTGSPETGSDPTLSGVVGRELYPNHGNAGGPAQVAHINCGQRPFAYTPPTGYKTLNTTNLPNPVIKRPSDHFDVKTYTGNGSALTVDNVAKQTSAVKFNQSLRFRSNRNATSLVRTPSASNRQKFTWSAWIKKSNPSIPDTKDQMLFGAGTLGAAGSQYSFISFSTYSGTAGIKNSIRFATGIWAVSGDYDAASTTGFTDPDNWMHVVVACDSTLTSAANRVKIYVNGSLLNNMVGYAGRATTASLNYSWAFNNNVPHYIGAFPGSSTSYVPFDGYICDINFIDGAQVDVSEFGEYDASNYWIPKQYTGTYGTNGFYLPFNPDYDTSTITNTPDLTADFLVVAGGGGGGNGAGSPGTGGGAGGYRTSAGTSGGNVPAESSLGVLLNTPYTITVGAGGNGGSSGGASKGFDSVFASITSFGGGAGFSPGVDTYNYLVINQGGSGGGGVDDTRGGGTIGHGHGGGLAIVGAGGLGSGVGYNSGGGGGAGVIGTDATTSVAGSGGDGLASTITGSSVIRGGGGAGGNDSARVFGPAAGGAGGGGNSNYGAAGSPGTANTGGGGGAGSNRANAGGAGYAGANGGSGIVIIKIPNTRSATFSAGVTSSLNTGVSGYKIYTVTATSTTSETVTFS